jgi:hypothetical protein
VHDFFRTYNQLWVKTQTDIQSVLSHENQALLGRAEKVPSRKLDNYFKNQLS